MADCVWQGGARWSEKRRVYAKRSLCRLSRGANLQETGGKGSILSPVPLLRPALSRCYASLCTGHLLRLF